MTVVRLVLVVLVAIVFSVPAGMPSQAEALLIGSQGGCPSADGGCETWALTTQAPGTGGVIVPPPGSNLPNVTISIAPNPLWVAPEAGTSYVSNTPNSGLVRGSVANGTVVDFRETFTLPAGPGTWSGRLFVHADDSTSVFVDGVLLMAEAPSINNNYTVCSDVPIGCLAVTQGVFNIVLAAGTSHTFDFLTAQRNDDVFGLDYGVVLPEPGTILLLGTGLIGLGAALRRRGSRQD